MKVLVADDEPIARQVLRELIEEVEGAEVAGEASSGLETIEQVARLQPDVLLLDIQMPGLDGLAVARALQGGQLPVLIYVTAHEAHALEAFERGAVDYLLKPVRRERLEAALAKASTQLAGRRTSKPQEVRKIVGRKGQELHLIDPRDVVAFQAEGDLVWVISSGGRYEAGRPLRELEQKLPSPPFRRIHRGTIINTEHIRRLTPLSSKRWLVRLSNGLETVVSKRMAGAIREQTQW